MCMYLLLVEIFYTLLAQKNIIIPLQFRNKKYRWVWYKIKFYIVCKNMYVVIKYKFVKLFVQTYVCNVVSGTFIHIGHKYIIIL